MPSEHAQQALDILRDASLFEWYVIPLLAIVTYIYASEIHARRWNVVYCGLAFWGADWINEIVNSIFFHLNGHAPFWGAPGDTAFLILVGLNIEIMFMFAIAGIAWAKLLPADRAVKILGVPNRLFVALAGSAFCVAVEIWLNHPMLLPTRRYPQAYQLVKDIVADYSWQNWLAGKTYLITPPVLNRLKEIRTNTLIITGQNDLPRFHAIADMFHHKIHHSQRLTIPDTAHLTAMEQPDLFNQSLTNFLTSQQVESGIPTMKRT